ncbi:DUF2332 domain-containing protein [Microbacterium sp. NPDC077184]|uniref:DUF2332 domain-containing protein n=1 Tax=Microbacterium sp. NPDC077184 TaxID=3154764 RepID=UPI003447BF11
MMTGDGEARIAAAYADFGRRWAHGTSPLYERWAVGFAAAPGLVAWLAGLPPRMRQPNLIFAAMRWNGCPLDSWTSAHAWLEGNAEAVIATAAARSTQTNEPGRCATLLPPLSRLAGPLALLEVGAAAGLCLFPDRYGYRYETPAGSRVIPGSSAVDLECRTDRDDVVPDAAPDVVWRRGIDLSPVDAADADAVAWLETLIWPGPDHDRRVRQLRAASAVVAADPPKIITGDLLTHLEDAAAIAPDDATLVVFHSAVLMYLDAPDRDRFATLVTDLARRLGRDVVWISNETVGTFSTVDSRLPAGLDGSGRFVQTVDGVPVALAGQHGATYEVAPFRR